MKAIQVNEVEVVFQDNIEKLSMKRFNRFNKFLMIQNDVGNTFGDFDKRLQGVSSFLHHKLYDKAKSELINLRQMAWNAYTEFSPQGRALAVLVERIGDKKFTSHDAEDLDAIIDALNEIGFTQQHLVTQTAEIKKKLNP